MAIRTTRDGPLDLAAKTAFDVGLALLLLPMIAPIVAVLYLLVRRDGGPGFFGHERVCKNGRRFRCWKIRTMAVDASALLERHLAENPAAAAEWARDFKLADDPRITRLGAFLRRTSLDELPQVWNVLVGDMSFVGPRPVTEKELPKYRGSEWCYLTVKPGITGLWQVSGRNDVSYAARVRLDRQYRMTRTIGGDVAIIIRTAKAVLDGTGQ